MNRLSHLQALTSVREQRKIYKGLDALVFSVRGAWQRRKRVAQELSLEAHQALDQAAIFQKLDEAALQNKIEAARAIMRRHPHPPTDKLPEFLALSAVLAQRSLGLTPYPVQMMGALALLRGLLAEMATGEGKTLTVGIAAVVAGWSNRPVHVVTANDYLASRDVAKLQPLFGLAGLTAAAVTGEMKPPERQKGYAADITYTTPKDLLADFLRDRLKLGRQAQLSRRLLNESLNPASSTSAVPGLMRGLHWALVDEADSVLIDEAVTPLIISQPGDGEALRIACLLAKQTASQLVAGRDYEIDFKFRDIILRQSALPILHQSRESFPDPWKSQSRQVELVRTALIARELYSPESHYVVQNGKIELVDEFTGRIMLHRTLQLGLHQALEAKEEIEISQPNNIAASLSFQRYFRCYPRLSGVSGTVWESRSELWHIYHLAVVLIPTHRPCIRRLLPSLYSGRKENKWQRVLQDASEQHQAGRAVLVGTRSIEDSEELGLLMAQAGLECRILNATRHAQEAEIVALAGQPGRITIATNMAGRGTDIELHPEVKAAGGLHVIATEHSESGRIDRQLFGRSARQGDPGSARAVVSLEDELLRRYLPHPLLNYLKQHGNSFSTRTLGWMFSYAQSSAQRLAFRMRRNILRQDIWLDEHLTFSGKSSSL